MTKIAQNFWLKDLNASSPTDKVLSIDANGEVKESTKTLDEIGVISTLQQVLDEGNTSTTPAIFQSGINTVSVDPSNVEADDTIFKTILSATNLTFQDLSTTKQTSLNFVSPSVNRSIQLPDGDGILALESLTVPYTGATNDLNLGANDLTATQITGGILKSQAPVNPVVQLINTGASKTVSLAGNSSPSSSLYQVEMPPSSGVLALKSDTSLQAVTTQGNTTTNNIEIITTGGGDKLKLTENGQFGHSLAFYSALSGVTNTLTQENIPSGRNTISYLVFKNGTNELKVPDSDGTLQAFSVINTSTPQTTATLNASFPNVHLGFRVVNVDSTERYTYTKISASLWRRSELMTDI